MENTIKRVREKAAERNSPTEKRSEIWAEMGCGLDALVVPTGLLVRLSSQSHECMDFVPGDVSELTQWIEKNKDCSRLWVTLEDESYAMDLPSGLLIMSGSEVSESLKFIPMKQETARSWIRELTNDKQK